MLEVNTKWPAPTLKKYFATNLDKAIGENTFKSNISLSMDMSIFSHNARCDRPALFTSISN